MARNSETGRFLEGTSGNPAGRPKGARSKLGEAFLTKVLADFEKHGVAAIQAMRKAKPEAYVALISRLVAAETEVDGDQRSYVVYMPQKSANSDEWMRDWAEPIMRMSKPEKES